MLGRGPVVPPGTRGAVTVQVRQKRDQALAEVHRARMKLLRAGEV